MTALSPAHRGTTILDAIAQRSVARGVVAIVAGAALTAVAAQIVIPLWPVPITGQTFAVLFVGASLGAVRGMLAMALYATLGVIGLPVFAAASHGSLIGSPSGGYVIGFILAAGVTGWLTQRGWDRKILGTFLAFAAGTVAIYLVGLPWLAVVLSALPTEALVSAFGNPSLLVATLQAGLPPFLVGDTLKAVVAGLVLPVGWLIASRLRARRPE